MTATFRQVPEDFMVEEVLGWEPDGEGEHLFLRIRKRGVTTAEAVRRIARQAGVPVRQVSHAGLKDRQGVCIQWLSVHLPGQEDPDWTPLCDDELSVLEQCRNSRRLRIGTHAGNRFSIVLRGFRDPDGELERRMRSVRERGVPNYFGEQRFGRDNVHQLYDWFENGNVPRGRQHRSLLLSSARSLLFNRLLSWRVEQGDWDRLLAGDRMILDGSNSHFPAAAEQPERLAKRLLSGDVHPSGPLWGKGESAVTDAALALEQRLLHCFPVLCRGLEQRGLTMQRRSLRLPVQSLEYRAEEGGRLVLAFVLPTGAYATSVLRELCHYSDEGPLVVAEQDEVAGTGPRMSRGFGK